MARIHDLCIHASGGMGCWPLRTTQILTSGKFDPYRTLFYNTRQMSTGLSYEQSGVNYDSLDAFKRACQQAASTTTSALASHGLTEPRGVRGESAYLVETPTEYLAHVEEGLGTKNL